MREAEKVECLGTSVASPFPPFRRETAELDQASFLLVQLEPELGETSLESLQARLRLVPMLEADHKVVRIADYDKRPPER